MIAVRWRLPRMHWWTHPVSAVPHPLATRRLLPVRIALSVQRNK